MNSKLSFIPLLPVWAIGMIAVVLALILLLGSLMLIRKRVPSASIKGLAFLRLLAIALVVACLFHPVFTYTKQDVRRPDLLVMVDTSQSMGVKGKEGTPRLQRALETLRSKGIESHLANSYDLQWYSFDRDARPTPPAELAKAEAKGEGTDYKASLETAYRYHQLVATANDPAGSSIPPEVLIVSDGNDRGNSDPGEAARRLGLRVHTLAPPESIQGSTAPSCAIVGVQSPRKVLLGSEGRFRVTLRQSNAGDIPVIVELTEDGQEVSRQEVVFGKAEQERQINITYRPGSIGTKRCLLTVKPKAEGQPLETAAPYEISMQVAGHTKKVLVLENTIRWEFKYLWRVIEEDPNFAGTAFLSRGEGIYMQFSEPDNPIKLGGFPQSRAELEFFDIIILGDVNPKRWSPTLANALQELVSKDGRSLVYIAGPNLPRVAESPQISGLLPVELVPESGRPITGPIPIRISPEGISSSPFYKPVSGANVVDWGELPAIEQLYAPLRKRPAATTLVEAADRSNDYGNLIMVAEQTVGRGRVMYVGTDTLWRWQTLGRPDQSQNSPYKIFWQQALRAMAPNRWTEGNVNLYVQTDRSKYQAGDTIYVRAELQADRKVVNPKVEATLLTPDNQSLPLVLLPTPGNAQLFHTEFEAVQPGHYKINSTVQSEGNMLLDVSTELDVDPSGELASAPVNAAMLKRLATVTGGKEIDPAQKETWPATQLGDTTTIQRTHVIDLWNNYTLLCALMLVLGADWALRLLRGFV